MEYITTNIKKTVIARFDEGEDLFKALTECMENNNIKSGWFNIVGGLKKVTYGLYEGGEYRIISRDAKHCFELLPSFGNVTLKEGKTLIHAHISISDEDQGASSGGHLVEGSIVYPFVEVFIQECEGTIDRNYDEKTKLWLMKF